MDCFDNKYYRLNRKLMLLIGQWPYQSLSTKTKIWFLQFTILLPAIAFQVVKLIRTDLSFDLCVELMCNEVTVLLALIRSFVYSINVRQVKSLLHNIRLDWESLLNDDETEIFWETLEEGRVYALYYMIFLYTIFTCFVLAVLSSPLLSYLHLMNNSNGHQFIFRADYVIDQQKYYYFIIGHMIMVVMLVLNWVIASDTFFMILMHHIIGMFKVACYRFEHVFDNFDSETLHPSGRTNVCERVANAVHSHKNAAKFCDDIVSIFAWSNTLSLFLVIVNVTIAFYWAALSKGQGLKMALGITLGLGQLMHMFLLDIPAQKITDNSKEVIFKAYSSLWYMGQTKEQSLIIFSMLRGLRPSAMMLGKIYPMTLENYATEVKASFSYITLLMSLT